MPLLRHQFLWAILVIPVGILSGTASALFLWALDQATALRWANGWLLFLLPLAGLLIGWVYQKHGKSAEAGNNLIIEQIHQPGGGVPIRMAPLVLAGTLLTHLFGGSAGREGTAVQMGGSLAAAFARLCKIPPEHLPILLMGGVAAGFASVFGTPLAGAIFAMEVLVIGRLRYSALLPVLVASIVGDLTCSAWGAHHTVYHIAIAETANLLAPIDLLLLAKVVLAAAAFGLASQLFSSLTHRLQEIFAALAPSLPLRAALGGLLVIGLVYLVGTRDYLGLGVHASSPNGVSILSAFQDGGATPWSWFWKLLFTAVTLSAGFKGGEVTPLFFIGATLGHTLATLLGVPIDLFAGLGFIAVFAAATNTPLACAIMGIELFGGHYALYFVLACFVAYRFGGHTGIYAAQRIGNAKKLRPNLLPDLSLRELRALRAHNRHHPKPPAHMPETPNLHARPTGKVRLLLSPHEKLPPRTLWERLHPRPLYRAIVEAAQADGLRSAAAFATHFGYAADENAHPPKSTATAPALAVCVELVDDKPALEAFVARHPNLLQGKSITYQTIESWSSTPL